MLHSTYLYGPINERFILQSYANLLGAISFTESHPDKICDQISDAILDAYLAQDPYARVACECLVTTGILILVDEITAHGVF